MRCSTRSYKFFSVFGILIFAVFAHPQSTSQNFPTAVTTNEISGEIRARDIGDARVTAYYYTFGGDQGDIFVNVVTRNFTGDIDVFTVSGLRPLTKIVVYSDLSENETGRVIYLRKPEKLLLRVQGRSPNDDAATYKIKFAGSFAAADPSDVIAEPDLPEIKTDSESGIRVNSVGTIIEVKPKPTPVKDTVAESETEKDKAVEIVEKTETAKAEIPAKADPEPAEQAKAETPEPKTSMAVVITDNLPTAEKAVKPARKKRVRSKEPPVASETVSEPEKPLADPAADAALASVKTAKTGRKKRPAEELPNPLEKINLIILFKDGKTIERPMSEVFKFSVDKGMLTVISKDGSIGRYSILDVAKVTIE
jgi:hypothetical protein